MRWLVESLECRLVPTTDLGAHSVARLWNEALLAAIRIDTLRPTVQARNLYHTSAAMYDAWANYEADADTLFVADANFTNDPAAQREAISYAAYRVLNERFKASPGAATSLPRFTQLMIDLGFDPQVISTEGDSAAAVGNRIAATILQITLADGSNEANDYRDTTGYQSANEPLLVAGDTIQMNDPNAWQPLLIGPQPQPFLTPHWQGVTSFALPTLPEGQTVFYDQGAPPLLGTASDAEFKEAIIEVIRFSASLDGADPTLLDTSPGRIGNNPLGSNTGTGYDVNPSTGLPYTANEIIAADYYRVIAEYWADGPGSETPPGHWNLLANQASDALGAEKRLLGISETVSDLEWDVKLYLTLNGALHDAAITSWSHKEFYDYTRPISMIRYMGSLGQSSDPNSLSYHPNGLPLVDGLVEVITAATTAAGQRHAHLAGFEGQIAIRAWDRPETVNEAGAVEWIRAVEWAPYQAATFVTPAFPGYTSGHSTFSRAAAEVLTYFTGDSYFPNGLGTFNATANEYLRFEDGPTGDVQLQWATYYDAADEAGLSRLTGGIHVAADDFSGRRSGSLAGQAAFFRAQELYNPQASYIVSLYTDILERLPELTGLQNWLNQLEQGMTPEQISTFFFESQEHRTLQITTLYQDLLDRAPDAAGLEYWVQQALNGVTLESIRTSFLLSEEYQAKFATAETFVESLYENILDRASDTLGFQYWVDVTSAAGRQQVVESFLNSVEAKEKSLNDLYENYLNRAIDEIGLATWQNRLNTFSDSLEKVAQNILNSDEYLEDLI